MTDNIRGPARAEFTRADMIDGPRDVVRRLRGTGRSDWLNDTAAQFVPSGYGRPAGWVTIYDTEGVTVGADVSYARPRVLTLANTCSSTQMHHDDTRRCELQL